MAKKAGTLAVALTANSTAFDRTLARAEKRITSFASGVNKTFAGVGIALGAKALIGAGKSFLDNLDQIGKRAGVLGISAERYQELSFAAERTATSIGTVESAIIRANNVLAKAATGDKAAAGSFALLGLKVQQLKHLRPDEVFDRIAEALSTIEDPATRNQAILEVFGKTGQELNNFLREYLVLGNEARSIGAIVDNDAVAAAASINDQLTNLNKQITTLIANLGVLQKATDFIDSLQFADHSSFWGHVGTELVNGLGRSLTFGMVNDLGDRLGLTPSDAGYAGPVTQSQIAAANEKRAARIAEKEARSAAAADRAARTQEELARRLAATAKNQETKALNTIKGAAERAPDNAISGSFSLRDLAQSVTQGAPAERTAKASEALLDNAKKQTTLQQEIRKQLSGANLAPTFG